MKNVIFWLIVIGTGICTFQWTFNAHRSIRQKTMIIPILLLWIIIIYFYKNPEFSRYYMIWISPLIIIVGMIISVVTLNIKNWAESSRYEHYYYN